MSDFEIPFPSPTEEPHSPPIPHNAIRIATADEQKPLLKMIKRMLQPKHPKTKRFTRPKQQRKTKQKFY